MSENAESLLAYLQSLGKDQLDNIAELAKLDTFTINGKQYKRRKILVREHMALEKLRSDWVELVNKPESTGTQRTEAFMEIYVKGAEFFLGIPREEFYNIPFEDSQTVIDACNFRLRYGKPKEQKPDVK